MERGDTQCTESTLLNWATVMALLRPCYCFGHRSYLADERGEEGVQPPVRFDQLLVHPERPDDDDDDDAARGGEGREGREEREGRDV